MTRMLCLHCASGVSRVKEELQRKMEGIKVRLEQQEAMEKRLRSRLNKQDDKSKKIKEVLVLCNIAAHNSLCFEVYNLIYIKNGPCTTAQDSAHGAGTLSAQ